MTRICWLLAVALVAKIVVPSGQAAAQIMREHKAGESRALHGGAKPIRRSFKSDSEAQRLFGDVLRAAGLAGMEDRIQLRASAETDNAVAFIEGGERFIFYNAVYMQRLQEKDKNYWSLMAILAHEIAHHVRFHTDISGRNHEFELEADYQAGVILRRMGASLEQATSVFATFPKSATIWHPERAQRIQMVTLGWREGGSVERTDSSRSRQRGQVLSGATSVGSQTADIDTGGGSDSSAIDLARTKHEFVAKLRSLPLGDGLKECDLCPELVSVPGGNFAVGSPTNEKGRDADEGPQRQVTVLPFAMGKFEVTFAEWGACVADGGCNRYRPYDETWGRGDRPVINVSWHDAQAYVRWLNSKVTGTPYRLPSELEWEYAARAGTITAYWTGPTISSKNANFDARGERSFASSGTFLKKTISVKYYQPNYFGLYQVHGNVWEWVADCWSRTYPSEINDASPQKNGDCSRAVRRGGSWEDSPDYLRSANRASDLRGSRSNDLGFRIARSVEQ